MRCHHGVIRFDDASADLVPSIKAPNCTPLGHAGSHPLHCTHVSMKSTKVSSIGSSPDSTARIASMRPRGEYASSPDTLNVDSAAGRARMRHTSTTCRDQGSTRHRARQQRTRTGPPVRCPSCQKDTPFTRLPRGHERLLTGQTVRVTSPKRRFTGDAERFDGAVLNKIEPLGTDPYYLWIVQGASLMPGRFSTTAAAATAAMLDDAGH